MDRAFKRDFISLFKLLKKSQYIVFYKTLNAFEICKKRKQLYQHYYLDHNYTLKLNQHHID